MNNIKTIYKHSDKCDVQQNFKDIIDADMLSIPDEVTDNSPNVPMISTPVSKKVQGNHCVYSPTYWM